MWQDTVLSAALRSSELAQPGTFYGVPLAQLTAQAGPDTPEGEFVWKKTPNHFNLNLKRRQKIKIDDCHSSSWFHPYQGVATAVTKPQ